MFNQPLTSGNIGSVVESGSSKGPQGFAPSAPGSAPLTGSGATYSPNPADAVPLSRKSRNGKIAMIVSIVLLSIALVTFIVLFIMMLMERNEAQTNINGKIDEAVAIAEANKTEELEAEFLEREKYPYRTFTGPADYGSVSFEFPKTWNVYIAKDAANSGEDFEAYLNPGEVSPVSTTTINALRVNIINNRTFENSVSQYATAVQNGRLTMETRMVGGIIANIYRGEISNQIHGILCAFKLRDKTVMLRTDAELFADEFFKLLDTVNFVE